MPTSRFEAFEGEISGFGTTSGHRVVIGHWPSSPLGPFADVMHEAPDGVRTLLAPSAEVAAFIEGTYSFDVVTIVPVTVDRRPSGVSLVAGDLRATIEIGRRSPTGWLLRAMPRSIATSRWWCSLIDPIARVAMRGVRTRGTAGNGRHEWYGATDQHRVVGIECSLADTDLGSLADVWPPVRFGFSSTPRRPSTVAVTTTIEQR